MGESRMRNNVPRAADQPLRAVKARTKPGQYSLSTKSKEASAYNEIVKSVVTEVRAAQADAGDYSRDLLSTSIDNALDRIVFELSKREKSQKFTDQQLADIKEQVSKALAEQPMSYADMSAMKDDILSVVGALVSSGQEKPSEEPNAAAAKTGETEEDETVGKYQNSTPAENFSVLQDFVNEQFEKLNKSVEGVPGAAVGGISGMLTAGIGKVWSGISLLGRNVAGFTKNATQRMAGIAKAVTGGVFSGIGKTLNNISKGVGTVFGGIKGLGSKLSSGIMGGIAGMGAKIGGFFAKLNPFRGKTSKEKKAEKKRDSIFDSLDKLVKRLKKFADNMKQAVLSFIDEIVIPAAKIIAKGLSVILKPLMAFILGAIWGSGIGFFLVGIGLGIGLIGLAVNKLVDWVVDDVGPEIQRWLRVCTPETINNVMNAAANFMNTFSAMMAGLFAPIIAIGTLIMAAIQPIGEFIKELLTSVKDHLMPIIDKILGIIERTVVKILTVIEPIINKIIEITGGAILHILEVIEPIIHQIIDIVGGVIKTILEAIKPIIEELKPLIMIISDVICGVIKLTVMAIQAAIKGITDWWGDVQKEGGLWPWFKKRLVEWWDKVCNIARSIRDAISGWWNSPDNPVKALFDKLTNMIWSLPVIGTFRPFGFLAGKDFFLSEAEEKEYKEITSKREEAQDLQKEIDKLQKYIDTKDYKGGDGTARFGRTKEEMERDMAALRAKQTKLNAEANAAAAEKMKQSQDIAMQQVGPAMQQLNEVQAERTTAQQELSNEAKLYTKEVADAKAQAATEKIEQVDKIDSILDIVHNIQLNQTQTQSAQPDDLAAAAAAGGAAGGMAGRGMNFMYMENR